MPGLIGATLEYVMQIVFWVSPHGRRATSILAGWLVAAIFATASPGQQVDRKGTTLLPSGGFLRSSTKAGATRLEISAADANRKSAKWQLTLKRDATVSARAPIASVRVIGEVRGIAIVLADEYPSLPGGLSYCQAGKEQFLRVISIVGQQAKETLRLKLNSCRDNVELASPGLQWDPDLKTLKVHWLMATREGKAEDRTYKINGDGKAEAINAP